MFTDEYFMRLALQQANLAFTANEVPIGAIVVCNNTIVAKAYNQTELLQDVTAHAEILAITAAANYLGSKYLPNCALYGTVEPCLMCSGASYWAQLGKVVYGAADEKRGFTTLQKPVFHPKTQVVGGILATECAALMSDFFKQKR